MGGKRVASEAVEHVSKPGRADAHQSANWLCIGNCELAISLVASVRRGMVIAVEIDQTLRGD